MAQPTNTPEVAITDVNLPSTGNPNKAQPGVQIRDVGFDAGQKPAAEEINWLFDNINDWVKYVRDEVVTGTALPDATTTVKGISELATDAEADAGSDTTRNVTPSNLPTAVPANMPSASTTVKGKVELATNTETITGTDATRAVTPAGLQSKIASTTAKGIVELATVAEATAGTDTTRAVTSDGLVASIAANAPAPADASTTVKGIIEIATQAEVDAGTDTTRAITPSSLGAITNSQVTNGYQKLPGGTIIQWGTFAGLSSGNNTVNFPLAFPTAALVTVCTGESVGGAATNTHMGSKPLSTTQMQISRGADGPGTGLMIAIGH
jgi:hypothetical protein